MSHSKLVIAGGGMVAGYAAKQLVELGLAKGDLTILSSDSWLPYERPPLSKGFLAGRDSEESIQINPESFYAEHGIDVRLHSLITHVDPAGKRVVLQSGESIGFDKLIIATGSLVRKLDIPGAALGNVQYLRTLDDAKAIRQKTAGAKKAVVIGGGFIGMEVASVLAQAGVEVSMVLRQDRIWQQFFSPEMSRFFESYYMARGVRFIRQSAVTELRGEGSVVAAVLNAGQEISCDLVVAGIGVKPSTEIAETGGIQVKDGIVVNEYLETSVPGIYAAGDAANYFDVLFQKRRRVEHWDNAVSQGQHCAKVLLGERTVYRHVPYFFSDVFDLSYEFWGDTEGAEQVIHRGDVNSNSFSVWWIKQGVVVAAFVMNRPDEERNAAPLAIENRKSPTGDLADTAVGMSEIFGL